MIQVKNISKRYHIGPKTVEVLQDINLDIAKGECVLLWGPSGSGKTTLMNIIGLLTKPSGGDVYLDAKIATRVPEHFATMIRRKTIGFIFQQFHLLPGLNVLENVSASLITEGVSKKERWERAFVLLDRFGLKERQHFKVNELSGGEQQRVAVARALINDPAIILADEPNSNIDEQNTKILLEIFKQLKQDGKTIVISTHDKDLSESSIINRKISIVGGRIV